QRAQAQGLIAPSRRAELQRFVQEQLTQLNLGGVEVLAGGRSPLAQARPEELAAAPSWPADNVAGLWGGRGTPPTIHLGKGDVVRAAVPIRGADASIAGAVAVDYLVPRNVSQKARDISRAYQEYRQLNGIKQPLRNGYTLTLALITLVVIFSAMWFG